MPALPGARTAWLPYLERGVATCLRFFQRHAKFFHDIYARIATGKATIEEIGRELFPLTLEVASRRIKPWSDHRDIHNAITHLNPALMT
jgi:galactarate dehydratase